MEPNMTNLYKKFFVALFIGLYVFLTPALSGGEPIGSVNSLRTMTQYSGKAYPYRNLAVASGVGVIRENSAQGRLLARRAALLDARRNLLALRRELLNGFSPRDLSGHVAAHKVVGERVEGNLYFLDVEVPLDALLK